MDWSGGQTPQEHHDDPRVQALCNNLQDATAMLQGIWSVVTRLMSDKDPPMCALPCPRRDTVRVFPLSKRSPNVLVFSFPLTKSR